jgi:rare lipoprotein A
MASIDCAASSYIDFATDRPRLRKAIRLLAVVLGAASLAACAQSTVVSQKSEFRASRQASLQRDRTASAVTHRRVAAVRKHTPFARKDAGETKTASHGVASFYTEGTKTASGEKFNTMEMTAAHAFTDALSTSPIPQRTRSEWLARALPTSNSTSSNRIAKLN